MKCLLNVLHKIIPIIKGASMQLLPIYDSSVLYNPISGLKRAGESR